MTLCAISHLLNASSYSTTFSELLAHCTLLVEGTANFLGCATDSTLGCNRCISLTTLQSLCGECEVRRTLELTAHGA